MMRHTRTERTIVRTISSHLPKVSMLPICLHMHGTKSSPHPQFPSLEPLKQWSIEYAGCGSKLHSKLEWRNDVGCSIWKGNGSDFTWAEGSLKFGIEERQRLEAVCPRSGFQIKVEFGQASRSPAVSTLAIPGKSTCQLARTFATHEIEGRMLPMRILT